MRQSTWLELNIINTYEIFINILILLLIAMYNTPGFKCTK
jgi:hypothetical protein